MASINKVILVGRLTKTPEVRSTTTGKTITTFSIAVDKWNDDTNFFECKAWEKTGEFIGKYCDKGAQVAIDGRLDQESWEKDGKKHSKVVVQVDNIQPLSTIKKEESILDSAEDITEEVDMSEIPF